MRDELLGVRLEGRGLPRARRRHRGSARGARAARPDRGARRRRTGPSACGSYPRDRACARLAPAGIELAPPRREVSTGPGPPRLRDRRRPDRVRRGRPRPPRLHDQRDGAPARRRHADRSLRRPRDLEARRLRTVSPTSFAEDPLRLVRGLRFISQLDLDPATETLEQMRARGAGRGARLGRADRRRARRRRDGGALEAASRRASGEGARDRPRHRRARAAAAGVRAGDRVRRRRAATTP